MQKRILNHFGLSKESKNTKTTVSLPTLPNTGTRSFTRSLDRRNTSLLSVADPKTSSPFFQVLPTEIRRQILVEAFGKQRLHIRLDRSLPPARKWRKKSRETWLWASPRCHRDAPTLPFLSCIYAWDDLCLDRSCKEINYHSTMCDHTLGAMGWILASRQAYIEGIDVLYATNIINVSQKHVMLNIQELLLPSHLASIRSLEVKWDLEVMQFNPDSSSWGKDISRMELRPLFKAIRSSLPHLHKLLISLHTRFRCGSLDAAIFTGVLELMDELLQNLSGLQETYIAFPHSVFEGFRTDLAKRNVEPTYGELFRSGWFSRPIWWNGETRSLRRDKSEMSEGTVADVQADTRGYWIVDGLDDTLRHHIARCF
ncbi:hypothetical protein K491DRAFT_689159 [Lophiostoma macrostomum CBS 122681]|uniref:DUF7730 domain-containing protein n=1 Tax=Lophiostoma macrostomum CBS 122681 TaxID=1314788 RepID=A0A6A6TKV2_9PLEO|nr:hypothetical protein K491DRAFT_689159 [Lophiostoma macrostomum CBS 122681]